jgi:DNA polymerase-3 subunit beta
MRISIPKTALVAALTRCAAVAHDKTILPILTHVLIEALVGSLRIHATDLEVGYSTVIDNIVWLSGGDEVFSRYTLPAKKLLEIVKAIPVDMVDVATEGNQVFTISGGTASFVLHGLDPTEYPVVAVVEGEEITITAKSLHEAMAPVTYCQSKNPDKLNLNGMFFQLELNVEGDLFVVTAATDGHRLCLNTVPVVPVEEDESFISTSGELGVLGVGVTVPAKAISEILHLSTEGLAVLTMAGQQLCISIGDERLTLRLIDGTFPDVNRVIPKNQTGRIIVKRQALVDAIARVRIATDKENLRGIDMEISEDDQIVLAATLPMQGVEATDRVTAEIIDKPEPFRVSAEYLQQALSNISSTSIEMLFVDSMSPIMIIPAGTDFPQAIIMPMRGA